MGRPKANLTRFNFLDIAIDALESKTRWSANHSKRVEWIATSIGTFMGMDEEARHRLALASHLHDIGKIGISDLLLDKPALLTPAEFADIKKHPIIGANLFNAYFLDLLDFGVDVQDSGVSINDILTVIRHHHERFDGRGYPDGLSGRETSLFSRIVQLADAVDSMISDRPYREARGVDYAFAELVNNRGTQFDPEIVDAFVSNFDPGLLLTLNDVLNNAYPSFKPSYID